MPRHTKRPRILDLFKETAQTLADRPKNQTMARAFTKRAEAALRKDNGKDLGAIMSKKFQRFAKALQQATKAQAKQRHFILVDLGNRTPAEARAFVKKCTTFARMYGATARVIGKKLPIPSPARLRAMSDARHKTIGTTADMRPGDCMVRELDVSRLASPKELLRTLTDDQKAIAMLAALKTRQTFEIDLRTATDAEAAAYLKRYREKAKKLAKAYGISDTRWHEIESKLPKRIQAQIRKKVSGMPDGVPKCKTPGKLNRFPNAAPLGAPKVKNPRQAYACDHCALVINRRKSPRCCPECQHPMTAQPSKLRSPPVSVREWD